MMKLLELEVVSDPLANKILVVAQCVTHKDAPIVAVAIAPQVDLLVEYGWKQLFDLVEVTERYGLRNATPYVIDQCPWDLRQTRNSAPPMPSHLHSAV